MITVYKYPLLEAHAGQVMVENGAKFLHFGIQNGTPCVWMQVESETNLLERFRYEIYGTGHQIAPNRKYLQTTLDGPFVWHLYEVLS